MTHFVTSDFSPMIKSIAALQKFLWKYKREM
jgi:hypothetical protein